MTLAAVTLDDKYTLEQGRIYLTGMQALVRLPMMQRQRDRAAGLNTAGFISGYRGSPLGGLDQSAVAGASASSSSTTSGSSPASTRTWRRPRSGARQQVNLYPERQLRRRLRHVVRQGPRRRPHRRRLQARQLPPAPRAMAACSSLAGDDHAAQVLDPAAPVASTPSSTPMMPVLHPAGVQEFSISASTAGRCRAISGCWVGFKAHRRDRRSSASVDRRPASRRDRDARRFRDAAGRAQHPLARSSRSTQERRLRDCTSCRRRWPSPAPTGSTASCIDRPRARLGIVTAGKAYLDVRQALADLGIDDARCRGDRHPPLQGRHDLAARAGRACARFADGLEEILVVEEKRPLVEDQLKRSALQLRRDGRRGSSARSTSSGAPLLPRRRRARSRPQVARVDRAAHRPRFHPHAAHRASAWRCLDRPRSASCAGAKAPIERMPYFCSGCPHNTSTTRARRQPRALAGIGCHYMAIWMDRDTRPSRQMGGEGVTWIGQAPFTDDAARLRQPRRRHLLPLRLARDPRRGRRQASTSPTRSSTTTPSR